MPTLSNMLKDVTTFAFHVKFQPDYRSLFLKALPMFGSIIIISMHVVCILCALLILVILPLILGENIIGQITQHTESGVRTYTS